MLASCGPLSLKVSFWRISVILGRTTVYLITWLVLKRLLEMP